MKRVKEPSTWAGLAALFQVVAAAVPPQYQFIAQGLTVLAGGLAVHLQERSAAR